MLKISESARRQSEKPLRKLERDNFVVNIPGRGSAISHISSQEVADVFQIREIIESGVAKRVAQLKGNPLLQKEYERNLLILEEDSENEKHVHEYGDWEDVHLLIIRALENETLISIYTGYLLDRITRIRNHYSKNFTQRRYHDIISEHIEILDANNQRAEQRKQEEKNA